MSGDASLSAGVIGPGPARGAPRVQLGESFVEARELDGCFGLDALIVFGSVAHDSARADSDLDLAALLRSRPSAIALLEARADIERSVGRGVDLVDLESASPVLAMQIFRDGRCVFGENSPALAAFRAILPSRYADLKRVRSGAEAALAKRVARGS